MSDPLRIGIIGGGAIVQVAHLPVLKKLKTVEFAPSATPTSQGPGAGGPVRDQGRVR